MADFNVETLDKNLAFTYREIHCPILLEYARNKFSNQGILKSDETETYFYLKVEDDYILKLFPLLKEYKEIKEKENDIKLADYFGPGPNNVGAHISVVYPEECEGDLYMQEVGQMFDFKILNLLEVAVFNKTFYALTVSSSKLELLRNKYGLSSKLSYHGLLVPFHITIAISIPKDRS